MDVLQDILARISVAPFTRQLNHDGQLLRLRASLKKLAPVARPSGLKEAQKVCEAELASFPDDPALNGPTGLLKSRNGDLAGAVASLQRALKLVPNDPAHGPSWESFSPKQQQFEDAVAAFQQAHKLDPEDVIPSTALPNRCGCLAGVKRQSVNIG